MFTYYFLGNINDIKRKGLTNMGNKFSLKPDFRYFLIK